MHRRTGFYYTRKEDAEIFGGSLFEQNIWIFIYGFHGELIQK